MSSSMPGEQGGAEPHLDLLRSLRAVAGGPDEFVLDPARITDDRLVEIPEDEHPRPLPRRGGRIVWQAAR